MSAAVVTGARGFVGRALATRLPGPVQRVALGEPDWSRSLEAVAWRDATVFHLAARVHRAGDDDEAAFARDNAGKTEALARAAAAGGARRIVFLSTVKVFGEESPGRPFTVEDPPRPQDAYARSKHAAEEALRRVAQGCALEAVVVRSPLVYGAGAGGNLAALLRLADSAVPLPFAAVRNRRSFVHVDDLVRLLVACGTQAGAAGGLYLAAHPAPVSTPQLLGALRAALGRPPRLFAVPVAILEAGAALAGQGERMRRLTRSLEVDASPAASLGWRAELGIERCAADMAAAYRGAR